MNKIKKIFYIDYNFLIKHNMILNYNIKSFTRYDSYRSSLKRRTKKFNFLYDYILIYYYKNSIKYNDYQFNSISYKDIIKDLRNYKYLKFLKG